LSPRQTIVCGVPNAGRCAISARTMVQCAPATFTSNGSISACGFRCTAIA
jgi:hypothetical protein